MICELLVRTACVVIPAHTSSVMRLRNGRRRCDNATAMLIAMNYHRPLLSWIAYVGLGSCGRFRGATGSRLRNPAHISWRTWPPRGKSSERPLSPRHNSNINIVMTAGGGDKTAYEAKRWQKKKKNNTKKLCESVIFVVGKTKRTFLNKYKFKRCGD